MQLSYSWLPPSQPSFQSALAVSVIDFLEMRRALNSAIHHTPGIVQSPIAIMLAATRQR